MRKQAPAKSSTGSLRSLWQSVFYGADRALKTTIILFLSLIVVATIVIDIWYVNRSSDDAQMDVIDALYTTVQTLVTVGYGDFPFGDQPTALRIFDILLMLVGAALVAILFAQLTDLLVSRRIAATFGSQRAGTMRNHYIVVGLGGVGIRVVEQLRAAGKRVAVIDKEPSPRNVSRARALSVPVVVADATDSDALAAANLSAAAGVAVLTSSDLANIETGLAIRGELGDRRDSVTTVLRLFDRHLSATVQKAFGFREVRSTAALAAPWFVAAARSASRSRPR
ncbi:MAG: potassium channel family protein [Candidatus Nanopelagicales bacterium]